MNKVADKLVLFAAVFATVAALVGVWRWGVPFAAGFSPAGVALGQACPATPGCKTVGLLMRADTDAGHGVLAFRVGVRHPKDMERVLRRMTQVRNDALSHVSWPLRAHAEAAEIEVFHE